MSENTKKIHKEDIEDILPLTSMQEGMLFHYLSNPDSDMYFEQLCLKLEGYVRVELLEQAWKHVVAANEALRTIFRWEKLSKPIQVILKKYTPTIRIYDFSDLETDKSGALLDNIKLNDKKEKFNIGKEAYRITICKLAGNKCEMIISNHHILYDGWSNGIILREFSDAYGCLCMGKEPIRTVKTKYREYIKHYQNQDGDKQKRFWKEYLSGFDTKTRLPSYRFKNRDITEAAVNPREIPGDLTQDIKNFAKKRKITVAAVLYCAWGLLLQIYANSNDVIFGTTVSGRAAEVQGIENIVGLFINTIPLRINTNAGEKVSCLLDKVNADLRERASVECTPLVDIKSCCGIEGRETLFDSIVIFENYPLDKVSFNCGNKLNIQSYSIFEMTNFDLTLSITAFDKIALNLIYNTDVFEAETIERMLGHYINIIRSVISREHSKISEIDYLSDREKKQLLADFNDTGHFYSRDKTVHKLFEEQAERFPDKVCAVFQDRRMTYKELNEKSNRLARILWAKGAKKGNVIGVMVERSLEMLIGIMGILKAGGVYLPIDPQYPQERIRYMLEDSDTAVLLTQPHLAEKAGFNGHVVNLTDHSLDSGDSSNPGDTAAPRSLAYVIYTSGSTGNPKGVMISHRAVVNFIAGMLHEIDFSAGKTILALTTISFDIFVLETLLPLAAGMKIIVANEMQQRNPAELNSLIIKHDVNMLQVTPSRMQLLMADRSNLSCLRNLKEIMVGGEAFPVELLEGLRRMTDARIYNMYGPTETTVWSTVKNLTNDRNVNIGKPIANTRIYILDANDRLLPVGTAGELYISGDGLAEGYMGRPQLTQERFRANLFEPGNLMYGTGDLARWLPNGEIEHLGRKDHQIKIRGFRVELGEIEAVLLKHEAVKEAVVTVRGNDNESVYLCAYVVGNEKIDTAGLRAFLSGYLPDYMIPAHFVQLQRIPLTPNGKTDRAALPVPEKTVNENENLVSPRNKVEEEILAIWCRVLDAKSISVNDNFFNIGGNSLLLMQVYTQVDKLYPDQLAITDFFAYPTIAKIAEAIGSERASGGEGLLFKPLELPDEFFEEHSGDQETGVFNFKFQGPAAEKLSRISACEKVESFDVLLSIYLYVLSDISGKEQVAVQVTGGDYNRAMSLEADITQIDSPSDLFKWVNRKMKDEGVSNNYHMEDLSRFRADKGSREIIPFFYKQGTLRLEDSILEVCGVSMEVKDWGDEVDFICEYSAARLKKPKIKELVNIYIKLVSKYISTYDGLE